MTTNSYRSQSQRAGETSRRAEWLTGLTDPQLRALGSQRKVTGWDQLPLVKLIGELIQFEDIMEPVKG